MGRQSRRRAVLRKYARWAVRTPVRCVPSPTLEPEGRWAHPKVIYETKADAEAAAVELGAIEGCAYYAFACPFSRHHYHLTTTTYAATD